MPSFPARKDWPNCKLYSRGFTLVELILVISIMAIMAGAMIPSFSTYLRSQSLKQAQEGLKSDLRTLQNKALTGALSDRTVLYSGVQRAVTHWGVRFTQNNGTYTYFIAYAPSLNANPPSYTEARNECQTNYTSGDRLQGTGNLPSDMTYKSISGCLFYSFKNGVLTSVRTSAAAALTSPISLGYSTAASGSSDCRRLYFNFSGLIYSDNIATCP